VWQLAGVPAPRKLLTTYTLSADEPSRMAEVARQYRSARALKLKLTGSPLDSDRVNAVREARPDVWLGVDANRGLSPDLLDRLMHTLMSARVQLIEQPFPIGKEAWLRGRERSIPVAADESVQDASDVSRVAEYFDVINIKLDKCGGLTAGLLMTREAREHGLQVMVGNMGGTSLGTAPGFVLGQRCDIVDLDAPILIKEDIEPGVVYEDGYIWCPETVWGVDAQAAT
jgi:L-alanine-DL-glutamate epimerase-like enolase superfamily enzyme